MGPLADCAAGGDATPGSPREWNGGELYRVRNGIKSPRKVEKKASIICHFCYLQQVTSYL